MVILWYHTNSEFKNCWDNSKFVTSLLLLLTFYKTSAGLSIQNMMSFAYSFMVLKMLKTKYESNACLLLETDLRWLLWRLGLLGRALKSGLWPVMIERDNVEFRYLWLTALANDVTRVLRDNSDKVSHNSRGFYFHKNENSSGYFAFLSGLSSA